MKFSSFAQTLAQVIRVDAIPIYTRTLFEAALLEKDIFRLDEFSPSCFKNYYYGHVEINKLKNAIGIYMDFKLFEKYIQNHSLSLRQKLSETFLGTTTASVSTQIANIFSQIMLNDTSGGYNILSGRISIV